MVFAAATRVHAAPLARCTRMLVRGLHSSLSIDYLQYSSARAPLTSKIASTVEMTTAATRAAMTIFNCEEKNWRSLLFDGLTEGE